MKTKNHASLIRIVRNVFKSACICSSMSNELDEFVHEASWFDIGAAKACRLYEDLSRQYGWGSVRQGPAYDSVRKIFNNDEKNVGFYVVKGKTEGEPSLEDALKSVESKGLADCPCHQ